MVAGDIVKVSIPLTVGMAVGAVLIEQKELISSISLILCLLLAFLTVSFPRRSNGVIRILYFCLGSFCFSSRAIFPAIQQETIFGIDWLVKLTAKTNFSHETTGALLQALLSGQKNGLPREIIEEFRASGASHILALSGLHLGVIYAATSKVLSIMGRSQLFCIIRSTLCISLCGIYTLMTGAGPSIVRALLFITIRETASIFPDRRIDSLSVFALALTIQTVISPMVITSTGFQLSYLAMLGIFTIFPILKSWYPSTRLSDRFDPLRKIWVSASLSISCQLFTGPLAWLKFGSFPKYFLLTNLIALPLTEAVIIIAIITLSISSVFPESVISGYLIQTTDFLAQTMMEVLGTISRM